MFKELFEDTVAADIAGATVPNKPLRKRKGKEDCPCKENPMGEECQKKRLGEAMSRKCYDAIKGLEQYLPEATKELKKDIQSLIEKLKNECV